MAKQISFQFEGENYTLEFTRRTVKEMENEGFSISALRDRPVNMYPVLFAGAFKCHHKRIKREKIEQIYKKLPDKVSLAENLVEMYNDALETLFEEPEENTKNVQWKANF